MAIALVAQATSTGAQTGGTTGAVDTTGATLLVAVVTRYSGGVPTVSDSNSNTWTALTDRTGGEAAARIYYAVNPTVGSAHTFTIGGGGSDYYAKITVGAFSGAATSTPFDQQNGAGSGSGSTSLASGSVTPGEDNELIISVISTGTGSSGTYSVDNSMTKFSGEEPYEINVNEGHAGAYKIQTTATAIDATWSWTGSAVRAAAIATFKAAAAGGGVTVSPDAGQLTLTGYAPTINRTEHQIVLPSKADLTLTGFAPSISVSSGADVTVNPDAGQLTLTGYAPTINQTAHQVVRPDKGDLTLTGYAPTINVTEHIIVNPATGALVITGYAPTVGQGITITPDAGALTLTGYAPTIQVTGNAWINAETGQLEITGYAPSITVTGQIATTAVVGGGRARRRKAYVVTFQEQDYIFDSQESAQEFLDAARAVLPAKRGRPRKPKVVTAPAVEIQASPMVRLPDMSIVQTQRDEASAWKALEIMRDEEEINILMAVL